MSEHVSREPWRENAEWVWDQSLNPQLSCIAVLEVKLTSDQTDLALATDNWLNQLHFDSENTWFWGGFSCLVLLKTKSEITMQLSSAGEDTYESLVHASRWLYQDLIEPYKDVRAEWLELPLQTAHQ